MTWKKLTQVIVLDSTKVKKGGQNGGTYVLLNM